MAKNKDLDLGSEFEDFESDFGDFNFDDTTVSNSDSNRTPITKVREGLTSGLTSTAKKIGPQLARSIDNHIPSVGSLVGEGMQFASGAEAMRQKFLRDANANITTIKRAARVIAPKYTKYLPAGLERKINKILETPESFKSASVEESRTAAINETLAQIFAVQEKRAQGQLDEERVERLANKTVETTRHENLIKVVDSIRLATEFQKSFTETVGISYLKKSLELKYHHLFVAKDTLAVVQGMAKVLETKLEQIRHNSALPDIQKQKLSESYKDVMRASVSQRINTSLGEWGGRILKNIQSKVLDPVVQGLQMTAGGLDMYASIEESMKDFGVQEETGAQKIGGIAGALLASRLGKAASKKLFGDYDTPGVLSPYTRGVGDIASQFKLRMMLKAKELQENAEPGSMTEFLADILAPGVTRGAGSIVNDMSNPYEPVPFDRAVRQSIVEVMPGYLAKSVQLLEKLATGKDTEELVYDHTKRDFLRQSSFRRKVIDEAFGTDEARGRALGEAVGAYRGVTAHMGGDVLAFDEVSETIAKIITNHALKKYYLKPEALKKYAEGDELSDKEEQYIVRVFEGISNKRDVARIMVEPLFDESGKKNIASIIEIDRHIISMMGRDGYLDVLPQHLNTLGQARHLKDLFEARGSSFEINQDAVRRIAQGGTSYSFAEGVTTTSDYTKSRLDREIADRRATNDVVKSLTKLLGDSDAREINESELAKYERDIQISDQLADLGTSSSMDEYASSGLKLRTPRRRIARRSGYPQVTVPTVASADTSGLVELLKTHAERQHPVPDLLEKIAASSSEMNDKMLSLMGTTGSVFGNLLHRGKTFGQSQLERLINVKNRLTGKFSGFGGKVAGFGEDMYLRALYGMDYLRKFGRGSGGAGDSGGILGMGKRMAGMAMGGLYGTADMIGGIGRSAFGRLSGKYQNMRESVASWKDSIKDKYSGKYKRGLVKTRQLGRKIKNLVDVRYVDIYRKDEVDPGNPLLTKKKQVSGVVFPSGRKVQSSFDIKHPVLDPKSGETLISKEDIDHGLVDVNNKPLTTGISALGFAKKGLGKMFGGFGKIKDIFSSDNPLMKILAGGLGTAFDLTKLAGKFSYNMLAKAFKFDDTSVNRKSLKELVGDKLDKIYDFLVDRFGEGKAAKTKDQSSDPTAGDLDADGKKDTVFERLVRGRKDKAEKAAALDQKSIKESLKTLVDNSKKQIDLAKGTLKAQKEAADNADGGWMDKILTFLGIRSAAGGIMGGLKGAAGSLMARVGLGGLATKLGMGAAASAAAGGGAAAAGATAAGATAAGGGLMASLGGLASATGGALAAGGSALAGLIASNPIGWLVGGTIAATYLGYKYLNPSGDAGIETRAKTYGVNLDTSTGIFGESYTKKLIALEEKTAEIFERSASPMNDSDIKYWAMRFGFNGKSEEEVRYWATWYRQRFYPAFRIYIDLIKKAGYNYGNIDDIPEDVSKQIGQIFVEQTKSHASQYRDLTPDKKGFDLFTKTYAKMKKDQDEGKDTKSQKDLDAGEQGREANSDTTRYTKKYGASSDYAAASSRMTDQNKKVTKSDVTEARGSSFWDKTKSFFGFGSAPGQKEIEPIDTSGYKASPPNSDELGALSAKFESAKAGSVAIGWDSTGGTSYGKYQIAARTGTFERFLTFADRAGGDGAEVAKRLRDAGPYDTGSRNGAVPNEWKRLVMEGKMGDLEHQFIQKTHYEPALGSLNPALQDMVSKSKALQDVLWSTAVQHGAGGAARIFNAAYAQAGPQTDPENLIKLIYGKRSGNFPSSTASVQASVKSRFREESAIALAMLAKEKSSSDGAKTEEGTPTAGTPLPDTGAVAENTPKPQAPNVPKINAAADASGNAPSSMTERASTTTPTQTASVTVPNGAPTPTVSTETPAATKTAGGDSGNTELRQINTNLVQVINRLDALVTSQTVLTEIRDGISSGFSSVASMTASGAQSAVATPASSSSPSHVSKSAGAPAISMNRKLPAASARST